jgi:hypothetical protein
MDRFFKVIKRKCNLKKLKIKYSQETTHFFVEIRTQSHTDFINYQTLPNLYARSFEENNQNYLLCPVLPQHSTQSKISPSSRQINYHKKEDNQRKKNNSDLNL